MGRLDNKVALITGGNSGIGRATVRLFAEEGASVFVVSRREDRNAEIEEEIREAGGTVASAALDLSTAENCRAAVDACLAAFGRIDVLVNSAGIADKHKPINRCEEDWYDYVVKIDQYSTYWMCKYTLEDMEKRGEGSIVNISSIGSEGCRHRDDEEHRLLLRKHGNPLQRRCAGPHSHRAQHARKDCDVR